MFCKISLHKRIFLFNLPICFILEEHFLKLICVGVAVGYVFNDLSVVVRLKFVDLSVLIVLLLVPEVIWPEETADEDSVSLLAVKDVFDLSWNK